MNETDIVILVFSGISGFVFARYDRRIFSYINSRINFYNLETIYPNPVEGKDIIITHHHLFWDHIHFEIVKEGRLF